MKNWIENSPMSVAIGLVALGFIVLFLGWNGAAGKDFVEGQVPYLVSGGLLGLALVGSGLTVVLVQAHRRDTHELINRIDRLQEVLRPSVSGDDGATQEGANGRRRRAHGDREQRPLEAEGRTTKARKVRAKG